MSEETSAITVFQEMKVAPAQSHKILDLDPEFATRTEEEQREIVTFFLKQGANTQENVKSRFPTIKMLHAGACSFEMPLEEGSDKKPTP